MKQNASSRRKRSKNKSILRLPDLEHAKAAVLNSLNSTDAKRVIVTPSMSSLTGIARNRLHPVPNGVKTQPYLVESVRLYV